MKTKVQNGIKMGPELNLRKTKLRTRGTATTLKWWIASVF